MLTAVGRARFGVGMCICRHRGYTVQVRPGAGYLVMKAGPSWPTPVMQAAARGVQNRRRSRNGLTIKLNGAPVVFESKASSMA